MKLAHSANQDVPIKFFSTARDDNNSLRDVLLHAILDDCRTTNQASRLGPKPWPWARTQEPSPARNESGVICMHLGRPTQAIRLAVEWGDAAITRSQLQESSQVNNNSLRVELETALLAADYELIKVLTTYYLLLTTYYLLLTTYYLLLTMSSSRCSLTSRPTPARFASTGWWGMTW